MSEKTTHQFDVHQNIIYDVIAKQAGSRGKSILEGVMNSVDAHASYVAIELDPKGFRITDDGKGMTEQEILSFFKTFGQPHEEGDAIHGRFRIGRGQMMVWGAMLWSTGDHDLHVDFKDRGLDFDMVKRREPIQGTDIRVTFYQWLTPYQLLSAEREVRSLTAYTAIPVTLNGDQINTLPQDMDWDVETDRYYVKFKSNSGAGQFTEFYSQGSYVCHQRTGVSALVVSKIGQSFSLNMARNQILEDSDEMYGEIMDLIRKRAREQSQKSSQRMDDNLRREIMQEVASGAYQLGEWAEQITGDADMQKTIASLRTRTTFVNALGKGVAPKKIASSRWCIAPQPKAERSDQLIQKGVVALDPHLLEWAGVSDTIATMRIIEGDDREAERDLARRFVSTVLGEEVSVDHTGKRYSVPAPHEMRHFECFQTLCESMTGEHESMKKNDLSKKQQCVLTALGAPNRRLSNLIKHMARDQIIDTAYREHNTRHIQPGQSPSAEAWTDGRNHIWIEVDNLKIANINDASFLIQLLIHEYIHQGPTNRAHEHDMDFYETFHEIAMNRHLQVGELAKELMKDYEKRLRQRGLKVSSNVETQSRVTDELPHYME